jgi:hypothetical protein
MKLRILFFIIIFILLFPASFFVFQFFSKAAPVKANILIDTTKTMGSFPDRWRAFSQGGEEKGVPMLKNVIPYLSNLYPRYIRLDHIYDYYDVVSRDNRGQLQFNWKSLDETVCDIYHAGAKPFFSLGYMPPIISEDGSLISKPKKWSEWSTVVQKTIEHYSGKSTRLCGQITGYWTTDLYYEVWNEPDLETFGKWSLYNGSKDYKTLYFYSVKGANNASDVNKFLIGGPATTALYQNWIQIFLDYVIVNNLRLDFISWHHYSKNPSDFTNDIISLNKWLTPTQYQQYQRLPKIISEWGFDSDINPSTHSEIGAAYVISAIRNFIGANYEMAFLFEVKDGPTPRWGIFSYDSSPKPEYYALKMMNDLEDTRLQVTGEGTYITALATKSFEKTVVIMSNYDIENNNAELVPLTLINLPNADYVLTTKYSNGSESHINITITNNQLNRAILMEPNSVVNLILEKKQL